MSLGFRLKQTQQNELPIRKGKEEGEHDSHRIESNLLSLLHRRQRHVGHGATPGTAPTTQAGSEALSAGQGFSQEAITHGTRAPMQHRPNMTSLPCNTAPEQHCPNMIFLRCNTAYCNAAPVQRCPSVTWPPTHGCPQPHAGEAVQLSAHTLRAKAPARQISLQPKRSYPTLQFKLTITW